MMRVSSQPSFDQIPSNRELLRLFVASRDEGAFAQLVQRFGPMVLGVARRLLGDFDDADDAMQLAFAELSRRAGTIENPDGLASWLHTVTVHIALRLRKRRPGHGALVADPVDPRLSLDDVARRSDYEILSEELERLPPDWREPLVLRYFAGLSNEEAAVQLGTTVTAVEGRLKRGKKSLRVRLLRRGVSAAAILAALAPARFADAAGTELLDTEVWSSVTDAANDVASDPTTLTFVPSAEPTTMVTPFLTFKAAVATGTAAIVLTMLGGDGHGGAKPTAAVGVSTVSAADESEGAGSETAISASVESTADDLTEPVQTVSDAEPAQAATSPNNTTGRTGVRFCCR